MKAELRIITPEWARKVLDELNPKNRAINAKHVAKLAEEMRAGRWKVNGDAIRFDLYGLLADGQHRLAAVVLSGITIQSFVVEGLASDVFDTIDSAIKVRSPGDMLGIHGELNAYRLASVLAMVDRYMTGRGDKVVDYTNTEIEALLHKYPGVRASLQLASKARGLMPPSLLDTCHYIFSQKDKLMADEFVVKVIKGTGLAEGDPYFVLRSRLVSNSIAKASLSKPYILALCIKAWNFTRKGMRVRNLRWRDAGKGTEAFPVAI
jgi:hypothetical protein